MKVYQFTLTADKEPNMCSQIICISLTSITGTWNKSRYNKPKQGIPGRIHKILYPFIPCGFILQYLNSNFRPSKIQIRIRISYFRWSKVDTIKLIKHTVKIFINRVHNFITVIYLQTLCSDKFNLVGICIEVVNPCTAK
jgi:hypothetical protein